MAKTKTTGFYFRCSPEEMAWIERGMAQTGISNKSAYLRKMAIDGHVFVLDSPALNEIGRLLRITTNNVNQLAKRVNSGGEAYRQDIDDVNNQLTAIRENFGEVLTELSAIDGKPGKRFTLPPTIREASVAPELPEYNQIAEKSEVV
jgi:hypothetical protein